MAHLHRLFFALNLSVDAIKTLDSWRRVLVLTSGRWVPMANLHLTLAFLGAVDDNTLDKLLDSTMENLRPFPLTFGKLGYFSKLNALFIAPTSVPDELKLLTEHCQHLQSRYGSAKKDSRYQPHITLARNVEPPVPAATTPLILTLDCQQFSLMASHNSRAGVSYQELARWPLQRPLRPQSQ